MHIRNSTLLAAIVTFLGVVTFPLHAGVNPQGVLGKAPQAPTDVSGLPGGGMHPKVVTGGFSVDTSSREQVREFYKAVYTSSDGVPIHSTAEVANCVPGTNSAEFVNVTLRRINWFRAMAGIPAAIAFDSTESAKDQEAALMMAKQGQLQHVGDWTGWGCLSADGTNASGSSNLALGNYGPDAITAYIWDFGANNYEVGHRRWILYPQTQIMGTGDVPPQGSYYSANATWVFDANYGGPRPATRTPFIAWPPAGYVPYQVVFPQWSFALSNADLSASTVTMTSNGVPVAITQQSYVTGYGENTLVWFPTSLDPTIETPFPFSGTDTVYSVTVNNVGTSAGKKSFSYTVTVFDPTKPGADYAPLAISGSSQPVVNAGNLYSCTASTNPAVTGYQWVISQSTNGYLVDNALNGLTNFTISPAPDYPIITNPPTGGGKCFHLTHLNPDPQLLQLKELLFPSNTASLSFKSLLGYATSDEVARVQVSTDGGGTWQDIYTQAGTNNSGESSFTQHTLSLAAYAGKSTVLRFNYDFSYGSYYNSTEPYVGWCIENVTVANSLRLFNQVTNATSSTNFIFSPTQIESYLLQARSVVFGEFPTDLGTGKEVTVINVPPQIRIQSLAVADGQVTIRFALTAGTATGFHLLQADQLDGAWTTNSTAVLSTNVADNSFQFTTTTGPAIRFYRVQTP